MLIKESAHTDVENEHIEKEAQRTLAEHEKCYDPSTSSNASETDSDADMMLKDLTLIALAVCIWTLIRL